MAKAMNQPSEIDSAISSINVFEEHHQVNLTKSSRHGHQIKEKTINDYTSDEENSKEYIQYQDTFGKSGFMESERILMYENFLREDDEEEEMTRYQMKDEDLFVETSTERIMEEPRDVGLDHVLSEIPVEVFSDRKNIISKLKEYLMESPILKKKNRLLELAIVRYLKKIQRKVTPIDLGKPPEDMDKIYRRAVLAYKQQLDEIMTQENQLMSEIDDYESRVQAMCDEDTRNFKELQNQEKSIASDLIYAKTGKKLMERIILKMLWRQVTRRDVLKDTRFDYIIHQHRLKKLGDQLSCVEALGKGMTTMDYETLRLENIEKRDNLDDRDRELEKLHSRMEHLSNEISHFKEKEISLIEDTQIEEELLQNYKKKFFRIREDVNNIRLAQRDIRWAYNTRKVNAGLLLFKPQLLDMEIINNLLRTTRKNISEIQEKMKLY